MIHKFLSRELKEMVKMIKEPGVMRIYALTRGETQHHLFEYYRQQQEDLHKIHLEMIKQLEKMEKISAWFKDPLQPYDMDKDGA